MIPIDGYYPIDNIAMILYNKFFVEPSQSCFVCLLERFSAQNDRKYLSHSQTFFILFSNIWFEPSDTEKKKWKKLFPNFLVGHLLQSFAGWLSVLLVSVFTRKYSNVCGQ